MRERFERLRRHAHAAGAALGASLRFLTRLPVPRLGPADDSARLPELSRQAWAFPLAGAVVGLVAGAALAVCSWLGLGALPAAGVAVAVTVAATGGLHEDGLADTADGLAAGGSAERRLAVMRDSRIGAAGATALALSLILRVAALAAVTEHAPALAFAVLVAANGASRAAALAPLALLAGARRDGIAAAAGRPPRAALAAAAVAAAIVGVVVLLPLAHLGVALAGLAAAAVAALLVTRTAAKAFGGATGDVGGAAEQAAQVAFLLAAAAALS